MMKITQTHIESCSYQIGVFKIKKWDVTCETWQAKYVKLLQIERFLKVPIITQDEVRLTDVHWSQVPLLCYLSHQEALSWVRFKDMLHSTLPWIPYVSLPGTYKVKERQRETSESFTSPRPSLKSVFLGFLIEEIRFQGFPARTTTMQN